MEKKSETWTFRLTIFVSSSENLELKKRERGVYYVGQLEGFGVAVKPPPQDISGALWSPPLSRPSPWPHTMVNHHLGTVSARSALEMISECSSSSFISHSLCRRKPKARVQHTHTHTHAVTPAAQPISLASIVSLKPSVTVLHFSNYLPGFFFF